MSAADLETATPPSACGLVISLPLTRADFEADLAMGDAMDYSRHHLLMGRPPDRAWEEDGARIAAAGRQLAAVAGDLGVVVCCASTLDCIGTLFRTCSVVTLAAHWRGASLRGGDFRGEPRLLLQDIARGRDELRRELAGRLAAMDVQRAMDAESPAKRAALTAELLNDAIIDSDIPMPGCVGAGEELVYRPWLRFRHRQLLDAAYPDLLSPGNRIELRDGLHTPNAIAEAIPADWSGIIDLALCESAAAATIIKGGRTERRVVFNNNQIVPEIRLRILGELYRRLHRESGNYALQLSWIFRNMRDLWASIGDAVASGNWRS